MSEFKVEVKISGDVGRLRWDRQLVTADVLERAISLAADDAILAHNLRRIQVDIPAADRSARRALHRCGFRLEGRLREALSTDDGFADSLIYARLATDPVYGPHGFSGVMNSVLPTKRMIGHVVFRNTNGAVLLTETAYKDDWELPGGVVEPGESPRIGAIREVAEEIGLEIELGQPALMDWMPPYLSWEDAVEFIYDGGVLSDSVADGLGARDAEIRELHWVEPNEIAERVTELSARRIELVLAGFVGATENGFPLGKH